MTFLRRIKLLFFQFLGLSEGYICPLHLCLLESGKVTLQYGMLRKSQEYLNACKTEFPRANSALPGATLVNLHSFKQMKYCPRCRAAEEKWVSEKQIDWAQISQSLESKLSNTNPAKPDRLDEN